MGEEKFNLFNRELIVNDIGLIIRRHLTYKHCKFIEIKIEWDDDEVLVKLVGETYEIKHYINLRQWFENDAELGTHTLISSSAYNLKVKSKDYGNWSLRIVHKITERKSVEAFILNHKSGYSVILYDYSILPIIRIGKMLSCHEDLLKCEVLDSSINLLKTLEEEYSMTVEF